jgi:uncharacterized membrane protein
MAFCKNCGTNLPEGATFCSSCGTPVNAQAAPQPQQYQAAPNVNADAADAQSNKGMAVLSYFGILFLIPLLAAKNSKFAQFHARQGLTLCVFSVAYSIVIGIIKSILNATVTWRTLALFGTIESILSFLSIFFLVLAIIGIVNAVQGNAKELPLIGKIDFIKMFSKNK